MPYKPYSQYMDAPLDYRAIQDSEGVAHAINIQASDPEMPIQHIPTLCDSGIPRAAWTVGTLITCHKCISILA